MPNPMINFKYLPQLIFASVLILLGLHLFNVSFVVVDNITILLLVLLIIAPLSKSLKKIKWGDFEAEIEPAEVKKLESEVKQLSEDVSQKPPEIESIIQGILSVLEQDHILAMAKLRIELEKVLSKILFAIGKSNKSQIGLSSMLRTLEKSDSFDNKFIPPIRDVVAIGNRAIHGEEVSKETARNIANIGVDLLQRLYGELYELVIKPSETEKISSGEREKYFNSNYQVTTVVPLEEGPYLNRYIFDQEQLDQFLENYDEFAEFLVEIKKIKK